jgi:hypothetical protein
MIDFHQCQFQLFQLGKQELQDNEYSISGSAFLQDMQCFDPKLDTSHHIIIVRHLAHVCMVFTSYLYNHGMMPVEWVEPPNSLYPVRSGYSQSTIAK